MDHEHVQLVQRDPLLPAVRQGGHLVVPGVDLLQVGLAEDAQRRQVRLGVGAVRHGVDENADDVTARPRTRTAAPALRPEAR